MGLVAISPPRRLAPLIDQLWLYESHHRHSAERVLPNGRMQLLVSLSDSPYAIVTGPTTQPVTVETQAMRRLVGVSFRPGGARPFVGHPCAELVDQTVELDALWGRDGIELEDRLRCLASSAKGDVLFALGRFLEARLGSNWAPDPVVAHGVRALDRGCRVNAVVSATGWSRATVVRRFTDGVGLSPKQYAGLVRFQAAVRLLARGARNLAEVAQAAGYYDQPHLTRAFQRFSGLTPGRYAPRAGDEPNHLVIAE